MYYDLSISEYKPEDVPSLKALWIETFDDKPELVDRFFELLPSMGTGFVAECRGELLGCAYVLDAELWMPEKAPKNLSYIYAVAVEPFARGNGIGAKLTRQCQRYCWNRDIDICCTLPAEKSLYNWYNSVAGFEVVSRCRYDKLYPTDKGCEIRRLHADEYGFLRADLLKQNNYVNLLYGYLLYQQAICEAYGGGMFACEGGIACGYIDGKVLYIKEALNDSADFIPSLCNMLGAEYALVRRSDESAEPFMTVYSLVPPPDNLSFNLALD